MQLNPKTKKHILATKIQLSGMNSTSSMIHLCGLHIFPWHMVLHMMETLLGKWFIHASRLVELHPVTHDDAKSHKTTEHYCWNDVESPAWCLGKKRKQLLDEGLPMQGHAMFWKVCQCSFFLGLGCGCGVRNLNVYAPDNYFGGCATWNLPDLWNLLSRLRKYAISGNKVCISPSKQVCPKRSLPAKKGPFSMDSDDMWW